jgi:hypothetical protein
MKMRSRCNNPNVREYANYGGRGIRVCKRWDVFENFLDDMGLKPGPAYSIDRRDNTKGYSPSNFAWVTMKQQQRNRRDNRVIRYNGKTATLAEHCEMLGLRYGTVHARLQKGAPIEIAFSPHRPAYGSVSFRSKTKAGVCR